MITKCNCVRIQVARTQYDNEVQLCEGTGSEDAI